MNCPCGGRVIIRNNRGHDAANCQRCYACFSVETLISEVDDRGAMLGNLRAALAERDARIAELERALEDARMYHEPQCHTRAVDAFGDSRYRCNCGADEHNNRITAALSRKGTP